jgi:hypothetical protein
MLIMARGLSNENIREVPRFIYPLKLFWENAQPISKQNLLLFPH